MIPLSSSLPERHSITARDAQPSLFPGRRHSITGLPYAQVDTWISRALYHSIRPIFAASLNSLIVPNSELEQHQPQSWPPQTVSQPCLHRLSYGALRLTSHTVAFPVPTFHPGNKPYHPPYHQQYDTRGHFMTYGEDNLEEDLRNMRKVSVSSHLL